MNHHHLADDDDTTRKTSWEVDIAADIRRRSCSSFHGRTMPYMVALVGIPGSGKTTSASILSDLLNETDDRGSGTLVIPMDGYHYPLSVLQTFDNPVDVIYRRGAPDTFDSKALEQDLKTIKFSNKNGTSKVSIPGFDHAKGDPEPNKYVFDQSLHSIVICEGLYLLHWKEVTHIFDHKIFLDTDLNKAIDRVKTRNKCIPGYTPEEIDIRCDKVDRLNARIVLDSKSDADTIVKSVL